MFNGYWYKKRHVWIKERYNSKIREFGRVTKSEDAEFERKRRSVGGEGSGDAYYIVEFERNDCERFDKK